MNTLSSTGTKIVLNINQKKMRQIDESGSHDQRLVQNRTKLDMNEIGSARNKTRRKQKTFSQFPAITFGHLEAR